MKLHAQFYLLSTGWNGKDFSGPKKLIEACGSDSIAIIDARLSLPNAKTLAREIGKARGFLAFTIKYGESFSAAKEICGLQQV